MRFASGILAAVAVAMSAAPMAAYAGDVRPGDSIVSPSAAADTPVGAIGQRAGAQLEEKNAATAWLWIAVVGLIGGGIWIAIQTDSEPESP